MEYDKTRFDAAVKRFGEVFFVLDSDREYIVHGTDGYEIDDGMVEVRGMKDGELVVARFPLDCVEHHYTHKEV